jgi:hypothetical protein
MRPNNCYANNDLQEILCTPTRASMIGFDIANAEIQHTGRARSGKTWAEILRREKSILVKWQAASSYCPPPYYDPVWRPKAFAQPQMKA